MIAEKFKAIAQSNKVDGLLITDSKGFEIYNNGFTNTHKLHSLFQLSKYFFPNQTNTIVGIETTQHTTVIQEDEQNNIVTIRQKN